MSRPPKPQTNPEPQANPESQANPAALTRRVLLRWGGRGAAGLAWAAGGMGLLGRVRPARAAAALQASLEVCRPAGEALEALLAGNRRFAELWQSTAGERSPELTPAERMQRLAALFADPWSGTCQPDPAALAGGQRPWVAVLTCADSRVSPEWLFDLGPGQLFAVRSAGNTAFNAGIASLEYAVAELAVPLIVVLGHSGCGAVTAALGRDPLTPLLEELVLPIRASLVDAGWSSQAGDGADQGRRLDLTQAVQVHARSTAASLSRRSALLAEAQRQGALRITPAFLDLATGLVQLL